MKKVLVIKSRNIGDVLLTGPLCSSIKQAHFENEVTVAVKQGTEPMLCNHPHVDRVLTFPERGGDESKLSFIMRQWKWYRKIKKLGFDFAINTTEGDRGAITAWLSGAKNRIGLINDKNKTRWNHYLYTELRVLNQKMMHTVIRNIELRPKGMPTYHRVHLGISDQAQNVVEKILKNTVYDETKPIIHIHPVSRWFFKCWTDDGMAKVIDYLQCNWQCQIAVTSGPNDKEKQKLEKILTLCKSKPINLGGKLTLDQMIALTSKAKLFFGVDTAPMHMAAALDVPVIAIFGPSGAYEWGPWPNDWNGNEITPYSQRNGDQQNYPHTILQQERDCIPCGKDGCDGSKRSDCLETLRSELVIKTIDKVLQREGFKRSV